MLIKTLILLGVISPHWNVSRESRDWAKAFHKWVALKQTNKRSNISHKQNEIEVKIIEH